MKLVMIGGHTRNIGKTSVVEGIIRSLPQFNWTAVKITQFGHGVCSVNGKNCGCSVAEHPFAIDEETTYDSGTDTSRFLAAGARRSLWVRTKQGELFTALPLFREAIANDEFVIVESNSLRRFLVPDIYLQVVDRSNQDFKPSAQQFFDLCDAYVLANEKNDELVTHRETWLRRELENNKPIFIVSKDNRFVSQPMIDFVKSMLS